jgi:hypothetical protein
VVLGSTREQHRVFLSDTSFMPVISAVEIHAVCRGRQASRPAMAAVALAGRAAPPGAAILTPRGPAKRCSPYRV